MHSYTRRDFLERSLAVAAGLLIAPEVQCISAPESPDWVLDVPADGYPLIEVRGSHREIGRQLGSTMRKEISGLLGRSPDYARCQEYLLGKGRGRIERMLRHARTHFPQLVEELEGMAEALDLPFLKLFAFNCRSEINLLARADGCSTIALRKGDRMILVHNKDGGHQNVGRMYLARVTPPSGMTFLSFVYPGLLPGNGPGFNAAGIVQTTNYIEPMGLAGGVPRYFIGRAIMEARNLNEAVRIATMTPRAFSWHFNLASLPERRILSLETVAYPEHRNDLLEVEGLYVHTNHLLHRSLSVDAAGGRSYDVPYLSSTIRLNVLGRAIAERGTPNSVEEIISLLSLHEGRPYSPCRHPEKEVHGSTLGTAVFTAPSIGMTLYHGNPCRGFARTYSL